MSDAPDYRDTVFLPKTDFPMKAGLAALKAGESEATGALPPPELRTILGYGDYDSKAKPFIAG